MGRKHGFRGTPVRPSPVPSSSSRVFERRGDPLVTAREGREKFGRNVETENPDLDQYFASRAELLRPEQIARGNEFRKSIARQPSPQFRAYQTLAKMNRELAKAERGTQECREPKDAVFIYCPYCAFRAKDSRKVSAHLRLPKGHINACKGKPC